MYRYRSFLPSQLYVRSGDFSRGTVRGELNCAGKKYLIYGLAELIIEDLLLSVARDDGWARVSLWAKYPPTPFCHQEKYRVSFSPPRESFPPAVPLKDIGSPERGSETKWCTVNSLVEGSLAMGWLISTIPVSHWTMETCEPIETAKSATVEQPHYRRPPKPLG
jgi:hypothetical protein